MMGVRTIPISITLLVTSHLFPRHCTRDMGAENSQGIQKRRQQIC